MITNRKMDALYDEIREEHFDDPKALPQKLVALLNAGFDEEDECVFLSALKRSTPVQGADFPDKTRYACFVNHIHIEDFLENGGLPPMELLGRGLALASEVKEQLARLHGGKHFRIIVAFDGSSCTVRFHTLRADEEWSEKNPDRQAAEAIAILETHELES